MKTLIINGSPRKNGDTVTLINEMANNLSGEIKIIHTYYANISPCIDCRHCWKNDGCAIDDGMQEVYQLLNEVDNIILASPLYFMDLTGQLLSFASRLQYFYGLKHFRKEIQFRLKKKNAVLILVGGGDGTIEPESAIKTAKVILGNINATLIGTVIAWKTDILPVKDNLEALRQVREVALKLNELGSLTAIPRPLKG